MEDSSGGVPEQEQARTLEGQTLWLWRNGNHFWAFDNPYPCYENGDPMTLGEPTTTAILKTNTPRDRKPWFSNSTEAIRWLRNEARQWHDDNPEVAAHLFETATIFEKELKGARDAGALLSGACTAASQDAERYQWAKDILSGVDNLRADAKATLIAAALLQGQDIDTVIDAAIAKTR